MKKTYKLTAYILCLLMIFGGFAGCYGAKSERVSGGDSVLSSAQNTSYTPEELYSQLNVDFSQDLNKSLVKKIDDLQLKGEVNAIITFSEDCVTSLFNNDNEGYCSVSEFMASSRAKSFVKKAKSRRTRITDGLIKEGIISEVICGYDTLLDGAFVSTSYEKLAALGDYSGVERVILSDTYQTQAAITNPVKVYDTGIFDSSDVSYTGKGTIVAILDTGCDYTHTAFITHEVEDPLYDRSDIEAVLSDTRAYEFGDKRPTSVSGMISSRDVYYGNVTKNKIAFGYDYADKDPDIMPFSNEHGTHVAGIIGGCDSTITGVAINTQLAIMKVFSDYRSGAEDGDILAALEDSVVLGVDAINMSLGTSCGFTREVDKTYMNAVYDSINEAGISLVVAASNDYSSAYGSEFGNTNKTRNPDSATVGSPSTYEAAISVASINGRKDKYMLANGEREVFFLEAFNLAGDEYDFFSMLGVTAENSSTYEYVTVPGVGRPINYMGLDVNGKIALVKRGDITFEEKAQYAYEAGAVACIIYNNVFGDVRMTAGNNVKIPVVSIGKDDGTALAQKSAGKIEFNLNNVAGPFISDFSSWGPTPDLRLKPEITAHGGNILSSVPGGGYDEQSGTSMAAPNMCGISILIRQYVKEKYPELSATQVRDMVNQLCMSTATIARDRVGNPYSPRKQGAGLASIYNAVNTDAYLTVDGNNKTKLELGDDPKRTGVYEMEFNLKNLSDKAVSYTLGDYTLTESLSSSDKDYVAEMAYMLTNSTSFEVQNGSLSKGCIVKVDAHETAKIKATVTLSKQDKSYLNANFENGMFVEGFITLTNRDSKGVSLSVPYLAFYGDWAEAPIFDETFYNVETQAHNNAIDDDDKIKADYYPTTPLAKYYYDFIIPMGSYVWNMDNSDYRPIPATEEHSALSYSPDTMSGFFGVYAGLLRGAKSLETTIINVSSGETVWKKTEYNCYKAHNSSGAIRPYMSKAELDVLTEDESGDQKLLGNNNERFKVVLKASLDWNGETRNSNDTFEFSFYLDYEAPRVVGSTFRTEYDKVKKENRYYADIRVYDNHYVQSVRPIVLYKTKDEDGNDTDEIAYASLTSLPVPVYQSARGSETIVTIEITDYIDVIGKSMLPQGLSLYLNDYALNANLCYVPFPGAEEQGLSFSESEKTVAIGETFELASLLKYTSGEGTLVTDYMRNLVWESTDESVVSVVGGKIEGVGEGSATVKLYTRDYYGTGDNTELASITVNVTQNANGVLSPDSSQKATLKKLDFISYDTLFAYSGEIDISQIGESGTSGYFGKTKSLTFYPGEKVKLHYLMQPNNIAPSRYTLTWNSSNPQVATVDNNGVVTGVSKGFCSISLKIVIDGKTSILEARCSIEIKSEFIIQERELVAYKGNSENVVIPDDEGILFIGAFAFSHYEIDHTIYISDYEFYDNKKSPLEGGLIQNTIKSVVVPAGIQEIRKYAFYKCTNLQSVTLLSDDCDKIFESAFEGCTSLKTATLENVKVITDRAFYGCDKLTGINTKSAITVGVSAFEGCTALTAVDIRNLKSSGAYAFKDCTALTSVTTGALTQLSNGIFEGSKVREIEVYGETIPDGAFRNCTNLRTVNVHGNLTYLGDEAFCGCTRLSSVTFGGGCEVIGESAFAGCRGLKTFTMPSGDITLGGNVFGCTYNENGEFIANCEIATLNLQPTTRFINVGMFLFSGATNLTTVTANASKYYATDSYFLYSSDYTRIIIALPMFVNPNMVVPNFITSIEDGAFSACGITSFNVAEGSKLAYIGANAFAGCSLLKTVTLPECCTEVGESAFYGTEQLESLTAPGLKHIGDFAFAGSGLTEVTIADNAEIGTGAFFACRNLETVNLGNGVKVGRNAFGAYRTEQTINRYDGSIEHKLNYESALKTVNVNGEVFYADAYSFEGNDKLDTIDLSKAAQIGDYAFAYCQSITNVTLYLTESVGEGAFYMCTGIQTLDLSNVKSLGEAALFMYHTTETVTPPVDPNDKPTVTIAVDACAPVTSVTGLESLESVGYGAFAGMANIISISLPKVTDLQAYAFAYCTSLESVNIGNGVEYIYFGTFFNCESLVTITQGTGAAGELGKVIYVGTAAFKGSQISELYLPECLIIDDYAFAEDKAENPADEKHYLTSVIAPKALIIGEAAFYNCKALTNLDISGAAEIDDFALYGCELITELEISPSLKKVGGFVFYKAMGLENIYATVEQEKTYSATFDNVKIDNGVLYTRTNGDEYLLVVYPAAKQNDKYSVIEGTRRIENGAATFNPYLTELTLPMSLRYIGDAAFFGCENLNTVIFRSYYAPVLESSLLSLDGLVKITPENINEYEYFDYLYKYDFFYRYGKLTGITEVSEEDSGNSGTGSHSGHQEIDPENLINAVVYPVNNKNFVNYVASVRLTMVYPQNSSGYDSSLYKAYFAEKTQNGNRVNSGVTMGAYAIAFLDAYKALPNTVNRYDKKRVSEALTAYNALMNHAEEKAYVSDDKINSFLNKLAVYNADVVTDMIYKIYDVDRSEYSYNRIRNVYNAYNALTEQEKSLVTNYDVYLVKFADLEREMANKVDFNLDYKEYVFPDDRPTGLSASVIVTVSVAVPVVVIAAAVAVLLVLKKKGIIFKKASGGKSEAEPARGAEDNADGASAADGEEASKKSAEEQNAEGGEKSE